MTVLVKLTGAADGQAVYVNPAQVSYVRTRASGGLIGTQVLLGAAEVVVREPLNEVVALLERRSELCGPGLHGRYQQFTVNGGEAGGTPKLEMGTGATAVGKTLFVRLSRDGDGSRAAVSTVRTWPPAGFLSWRCSTRSTARVIKEVMLASEGRAQLLEGTTETAGRQGGTRSPADRNLGRLRRDVAPVAGRRCCVVAR